MISINLKNIFFLLVISLPVVAMERQEEESERSILLRLMQSMRNEEGCNICGQKGGNPTIFWLAPSGRYAHRECFDLIKSCEDDACNLIDSLFRGNEHRNFAHEKLAGLVMQYVQSHEACSIKDFFEKFGAVRLTEVFNNCCTVAIRQYLQELSKE